MVCTSDPENGRACPWAGVVQAAADATAMQVNQTSFWLHLFIKSTRRTSTQASPARQFSRLEGIPRHQLNQTWRAHGCGDRAKIWPTDVHEKGAVEAGVVPNVKKLSAEFQFLCLGDRKRLPECEVPVLLEGTAIGVPRQISVAGGSVGSYHRRRGEGGRVQVCSQPRLNRAAGQTIGYCLTGLKACGGLAWPDGSECGASRGINHREGLAGLESSHTTHDPAPQQSFLQPSGSREERQIIRIADYKPVSAVKIRQPA